MALSSDGMTKSRLDYWFASEIAHDLETDCSISAAPLTDHCIIKLSLIPQKKYKDGIKDIGNSFQISLNMTFSVRIEKKTTDDINTDSSLPNYRDKWKYLKYKIHQMSISYSKVLNRDNKQKEAGTVEVIKLY
ncbi:hypothetical protein ATANTOWER_029079 [Ataeniobius toweri]|uniref:Uncharacterized protein n=1 Tax=Ataeniobius toweri TaxID=208326 RepID=A0ABU7BK23_9TELE|nr:hypothetical protein [Ataeniobius toweri]